MRPARPRDRGGGRSAERPRDDVTDRRGSAPISDD